MTSLRDLAGLPGRRVAGLISGTSMDGIDVAICRIAGAGPGALVALEEFSCIPYKAALSERLKAAPDLTARDVAELNMLVGEAFAYALTLTGGESQIDLIGSHGQTIYHHSSVPGALKATLQVGDGDMIAERLGIHVVSDFRAADIVAGGQGAPLTPYADFILFGAVPGRAVLNLGGIANLTLLGKHLEDVRGFDCGPANAPLDRIANSEFGVPFDLDGAEARSGNYDPNLLIQLLDEDGFVAAPGPKSTGFEAYGVEFVKKLRARSGAAGSDLLRLATEYVVESIARQIPAETTELILAGGGVANLFLRQRLQERLAPRPIRRTDDLGVPLPSP